MLQKEAPDDGSASLIIITHPAPEQAIRRALARLDSSICKLEAMIRVEE